MRTLPEVRCADLDAATAQLLPDRETLSCSRGLRQRHERRRGQRGRRHQRGEHQRQRQRHRGPVPHERRRLVVRNLTWRRVCTLWRARRHHARATTRAPTRAPTRAMDTTAMHPAQSPPGGAPLDSLVARRERRSLRLAGRDRRHGAGAGPRFRPPGAELPGTPRRRAGHPALRAVASRTPSSGSGHTGRPHRRRRQPRLRSATFHRRTAAPGADAADRARTRHPSRRRPDRRPSREATVVPELQRHLDPSRRRRRFGPGPGMELPATGGRRGVGRIRRHWTSPWCAGATSWVPSSSSWQHP